MSLQNVQAELADLIVGGQTEQAIISPASHLVIYRHNYLAHLCGALMEIYPLVLALIGENAFKAAARDYSKQYPSRSGDLADYGEYFSNFLANYPPAAQLVYLSEVAMYEWACHEVMTAPDSAALDITQLKDIHQDDQADLQLALNQASCLLQFHYPIFEIIELCKGHIDSIEKLNVETTNLLIIRLHDELKLIPLQLADYYFLEDLQQGLNIDDALQSALDVDPEYDLNSKLHHWVTNQVITDILTT